MINFLFFKSQMNTFSIIINDFISVDVVSLPQFVLVSVEENV